MTKLSLNHYTKLLKDGGKIQAKKYDGSEINFYLNEDGELISEDEHGLETTSGLSYIELFYALDMKDDEDFIIEEFDDKYLVSDRSGFDQKLDKAILIGMNLKALGYSLDDIYASYNRNQKIEQLIDELSPDVLDLIEKKQIISNDDLESESDISKLLETLFKSGSITTCDDTEMSRQYSIIGGELVCISSNLSEKTGFLASTLLKDDIEGIVRGTVEAGITYPEIEFRDEKAEERVRFYLDTARLFSARLGFTNRDFENCYNNDRDFREAVNNQDKSIWERTNSSQQSSIKSITMDSVDGLTKSFVNNVNGKMFGQGKSILQEEEVVE